MVLSTQLTTHICTTFRPSLSRLHIPIFVPSLADVANLLEKRMDHEVRVPLLLFTCSYNSLVPSLHRQLFVHVGKKLAVETGKKATAIIICLLGICY